MLKILYLTPAWYGFKEILFDGRSDIQGLPSFLLPLKGLIDGGHEVHFVIMHTDQSVPELNISVDWLDPKSIKRFCFYDLRLPGKLISILRYRKVVDDLLATESYDFVYAHGTSTAVVRGLVKRHGVPFGQRLYGTFLWDNIQKEGLLKACIKHLVEYLSFVTKKEFLLITNDGSRGDLVKNRIFKDRQPPYEFLYWVNGVSKIEIDANELSDFSQQIHKPFVFYCARFDEWKRQDRVIRIIYELKCKNIIINAYFAGPFDTLGDHYYKYVTKLAEELGVLDQVVFLGSVSKKEIVFYNKCALASLSLYDVCNLTNVFHEMLASGALIIVKDDDVIREYISHEVNGFLVHDESGVVEVLERILAAPFRFDNLRENAISTSASRTKDWDVRIIDEVKLISKYALKRSL